MLITNIKLFFSNSFCSCVPLGCDHDCCRSSQPLCLFVAQTITQLKDLIEKNHESNPGSYVGHVIAAIDKDTKLKDVWVKMQVRDDEKQKRVRNWKLAFFPNGKVRQRLFLYLYSGL